MQAAAQPRQPQRHLPQTLQLPRLTAAELAAAVSQMLSLRKQRRGPNPMNPPQYFDLPTKDGVLQPLIAAKWVANSPLIMVDQYVPSLRQYHAIAMDVGDADPLGAANKDLDQSLTRLGIGHTFEIYEGNHTSRVRERFESKVIPFFAKQLK